jgi:hypothetical protein
MPTLGPKSVVITCDFAVHQSLPIAFVLREDFEQSEIARFPVAQIGFLNHYGRADSPAELGFVHKPNPYIKNAFLECVIDPIHDLAMDARVLSAELDLSQRQLHR